MVIESKPLLERTREAYLSLLADLAVQLEVAGTTERQTVEKEIAECEEFIGHINTELKNKHE